MMCHARSAWWLETKSCAPRKPRHRLASLGNPKKKKCSLLFDFRGGGFFLKWKGHFSFWDSALQVFGQCGGASIRTKFWQNYFLGRKGFAKTSADLFLNLEVANGKGGVWEGIFHLLRCFLLANFGRAIYKNSKIFFTIFSPSSTDFLHNQRTLTLLPSNKNEIQFSTFVSAILFGTGICVAGSIGTPITLTPPPKVTPEPHDTEPPPRETVTFFISVFV